MEQLLKYLELIWWARITRSEHKTFVAPASTLAQGVALGNGKCKAVILKFNSFVRNDTAGLAVAPTYIYFGDSQSTERELLRGVSSDVIFCNDLNEITIRNPFIADVQVQVLIYR